MNWENPEEVKKYHQDYRKANRKKFLGIQKRYRVRNQEELNKKSKQYRIKQALLTL